MIQRNQCTQKGIDRYFAWSQHYACTAGIILLIFIVLSSLFIEKVSCGNVKSRQYTQKIMCDLQYVCLLINCGGYN